MSLLGELLRGGWLRPVDMALANSMQRTRADTPELVMAAAALASRAVANGHSLLPLAQVGDLLAEIDSEREAPALPELAAWRAALRGSPWLGEGGVLALEHDCLALRRYWLYEQRLAAAINARLCAPPPTAIAAADQARAAQLFAPVGRGDDAQAQAALALLARPLLLLTGGPGTGKTTTVARALVLFAERFAREHDHALPRVLMAAPTGKAAARLAESVRENLQALRADGRLDAALAAALATIEAQTLHRLLGWQRTGTGFAHDAAHPLAADLVIVDEASMIDLPMMCKLVEAVPAPASLLLIGDRDQLPSVETGDVLAALCDAADAGDAPDAVAVSGAITPATRQLELPLGNGAVGRAIEGKRLHDFRVHLTHSHRTGAEVDVGALAAQVRDGRAPEALAGLAAQEFRGVHWHDAGDRALADAVLADAVPAYRAVQAASGVPEALALARSYRVLTAVREGPAGSQTLNALIEASLDPQRHGHGLFRGRLLLITQNSYRHQLFNGDIGIVWPDEFGELRVWFEAAGGPRAWLPAALPAHESAFALTVHKSQGSEFERVLLALPEHGARVISRELLYTGLTRCRREVTLWANADVLRAGIERRAQRWSGLAARISAS